MMNLQSLQMLTTFLTVIFLQMLLIILQLCIIGITSHKTLMTFLCINAMGLHIIIRMIPRIIQFTLVSKPIGCIFLNPTHTDIHKILSGDKLISTLLAIQCWMFMVVGYINRTAICQCNTINWANTLITYIHNTIDDQLLIFIQRPTSAVTKLTILISKSEPIVSFGPFIVVFGTPHITNIDTSASTFFLMSAPQVFVAGDTSIERILCRILYIAPDLISSFFRTPVLLGSGKELSLKLTNLLQLFLTQSLYKIHTVTKTKATDLLGHTRNLLLINHLSESIFQDFISSP